MMRAVGEEGLRREHASNYTVAKVFVALFASWECACLVRGNEETFEQKEELS